MRKTIFCVVFLAAAWRMCGQTASATPPELPKDPRELLAMAAPHYDFNDPALKPWHLKATYQLYDRDGKPTEQGTYEYWWASPKVYRSSWTRPGASHTDWHTADGKHAYLATGGALEYFEFNLQSSLLSAMPDSGDIDPAKTRLDREFVGSKDAKFPCIMVIPLMPQHGQTQVVPLGLFPTYCFDPKLPVLRAHYSFGTVSANYNKIVGFQNKYLSREIQFFEGKREVLSVEVDAITNLASTDPAFTPSTEASIAKLDKTAPVSAGVMVGMLIKKTAPVYPQDAKDARVSGTVVLQAIIGMDGGVHNLHVISAPWPSLAASSLSAVSQWKYKPYLMNGEPVDVETTINVIYSFGG